MGVVPSTPRRDSSTGKLLSPGFDGSRSKRDRKSRSCEFWEDRPRPQYEAKPLESIVEQIMKSQAPVKIRKVERIAEGLVRVEIIWESVVGSLAESTRVVRFRQGILEVMVDSPVLQQDLSFAKSDLTADLEAAGLEGVHEIRFKVGRV